MSESERMEIASVIFALVETEREKNPAFLAFSDDMTPSEFETLLCGTAAPRRMECSCDHAES